MPAHTKGNPKKKRNGKSKGMSVADLQICERFKATRINERLSQPKFALKLEINTPYVKAIEQKKYTPNFKVIRMWSKVFNVSYEWIIDGK